MPLLTSRGKRSFTYSVVILFILGVFALGYLFYFVPHNRKNINKNGFLILRTIATSIANGADSRTTNYINWIKNGKGVRETTASIFKEKNVESIDIRIRRKDSSFTRLKINGDKVIVSVDSADFKESGDSLYRRHLKDSIIQVSEPAEQFFKPILDFFLRSQKAELFQSYALEKISGKTTKFLYADTALALRTDIADSLLPTGKGSFTAGMRDLTSQNVEMKMFYYPFSIDDASFILSGFVDTEEYNQSIKKVPFYFVYPLVILFLLVLIFFPVIKFYLMDSNELLKVKDVIFFGVSTILGVALLTILIIQFLLWKADQQRAETNLIEISRQIKTAFTNELKKAYAEMELLDSFKRTNPPLKDFSNPLRSFLVRSRADTGYFHFDRIAWIDSTGQQKVKAELYGKPVFTNVKTRSYFQVFETGTPYSLPAMGDKKFGWEPIYSWTNNEFSIGISLKAGDTILAMITKMYSLVQTILPAGYGFCILDERGNVQVHSDSTRNLNENFLEKVDRAGDLKGVMAARQSKTIHHVGAYDKLHIMRIQPLDNSLPFYLVTFYDEGYIAPVNIRILIFSLLLCTLFFAICGIMWGLFAGKRSTDPLVHCKMDFLDWIAPRETDTAYYWQGFIFTIIYWLSIIGFVVFSRYYQISNFNILAILILTPVNIILFLQVLRLALLKDNKRRSINKIATTHFVISAIFFALATGVYPINFGFIFFQVIITTLMWFYGRISKGSSISYFGSSFNFLKCYKRLITSLVICLAVLPASLFTWYAHNQEFTQNVKRQQLYLANRIRERSFFIQQLTSGPDSLVPESYLDSLQFSYGIYKIYDDHIDNSCSQDNLKGDTHFEKFYFDVAENLSTPYYRQEAYASLQDKSDDNSWNWVIENKKLDFWYRPGLPTPRVNQKQQPKCLHLVSTLPPRFVFLTWQNIFPLLFLVILLVIGLFQWVGKRTEQIFLTRFIYAADNPGFEKAGPFASMINKLSLEEDKRLYTPLKYRDYSIECDDKSLLQFQKEVVADMNRGREFYSYVWSNRTEKEKFLLYGFALDGTINYKNTKEIIELMNQGVLLVVDERIRIFSPAFRAFILYSVNETEIARLQKEHRQNSTWHYIRVPLMILLIGIAALIFFTQQGVFDKILGLAAGISTLIGLVTRFFTAGGTPKKE